MHALPILLGTLCVLTLAYRYYSAFIAARVLALDDARPTPAHTRRDGRDYLPTNRWVLLGHHFAAITGAGPLIGPVLAAQFGFLPGLLWILVGVTLAGAVHDFIVLTASVRSGGRSLAQMAREQLGPLAGAIATLAIFFTVVVAIAAMAFTVVNILAESPWATFTIAATIPIAVVMGLLMRRGGHEAIGWVSTLGVALLVASVAGGRFAQGGSLGAALTLSRPTMVLAVCAYGFAASVLPVWLLLVPRDYLSAYMKVATIAALVVGIALVNPRLELAAITPFVVDGGGPLIPGRVFPFVFITVACGAISGFHSLIASGTTPKMVDRESDARMIGYGAMLMEGLVGVTSLIAAACLHPGDYYAINLSPAALAKAGFSPVELAEMSRQMGEQLAGRTGGSVSLAVGIAKIFAAVGAGGGALLAYWYHFIVMFEAVFILTTVDAGTRVARFLVQDVLGRVSAPLGRTDSPLGALVATSVVVACWGGFLATGSIQTLWPLLGVANQLLATTALCVATAWLWNAGKARYLWVTAIPMAFVGVTTVTAGTLSITGNYLRLARSGQVAGWVDAGIAAVLIASALAIAIELLVRLATGRMPSTRTPDGRRARFDLPRRRGLRSAPSPARTRSDSTLAPPSHPRSPTGGPRMVRALIAALALLVVGTTAAREAAAQTQPLPLPKGPRFSVKLDSSPQQAAVYVNDRQYGIQGYTPITLKLPRGSYQIILELPDFKTVQVPIEISRNAAYTVTLQRAPRPAVLDVRASGDGNALGGNIVVDGAAVGTLPNRIEVGPGNHVVEVQKAGFLPFRDNVQVSEGETRTITVPMAAQVKPGAIIVTADAPGAVVSVDGVRRDTAPTVVPDLSEGAHTVEVAAPGLPPWKQVVTVVAGQQTKVQATLQPAAPAAPQDGSLRVISATEGAEVFVDGASQGAPGKEVKGLEPGSHLVEVRASGFTSQRAQIDVAPGQVRTVAMDLVAAPKQAAKGAGLHIISSVPDAELFLDGASAGKLPFDRQDLAPGKHIVVARKAGFADFKTEVELTAGTTVNLTADLRSSGSLRVVANPAGANVFLDGTAVGVAPVTVPYVATGPHVVEIKQKDFVDYKQSVTVEGGQQGIVQADLAPVIHGPTPAELEKLQREQSTWSAMVLDRGHFAVDGGVGFPWYLSGRLQTGLAKWMGGRMGLDLGVEFRTNFLDSQVGLRPRVQLWRSDPFGVGVDVTLLGGGGPTNRNSVTFEIGPVATLAAGSYVHINIKPYLGVWSNQVSPTLDDIKNDDRATGMVDAAKMPIHGSGDLYGIGASPAKGSGEMDICKAFDRDRTTKDPTAYSLPGYWDNTAMKYTKEFPAFGQSDPRLRFTNARFMLQGSVEIAINRQLSLWVMVEGAPFQDQQQPLTSKFNVTMPDKDYNFYGRVGVTGKF